MTAEESEAMERALRAIEASPIAVAPPPPQRSQLVDGTRIERSHEWAPWTALEGDPLDHRVLLRLHHGGFVGRCPSYDVTVWRDGRVVYDGRDGVRVADRRERRMGADEIQRLETLLSSLPEESFDSAPYTHAGWDEAPCAFSREFVYRVGGQTRILRHLVDGDWQAPPCLRHLELRIVRLTGVVRWTGGDPLGDAPLTPPLH